MQFLNLLLFLVVASAPVALIYWFMWRELMRLFEPAKVTTPWGHLWSRFVFITYSQISRRSLQSSDNSHRTGEAVARIHRTPSTIRVFAMPDSMHEYRCILDIEKDPVISHPLAIPLQGKL